MIKNLFGKLIENRGKVWFAFLLNAVILSVLSMVFCAYYESSDDMGISNLVDGSRGSNSTHLIFLNRFVGMILKCLYQTISVVPWYVVLQYVILFLSFTAITYVMLQRLKSAYYFWVLTIFLTVFSYESYILIQFTKTAAIATVAGVALIFYGMFKDKVSKRMIFFGYVLAIVGSFYRFDQFLAEIAMLATIGLYFLFWLRRKENIIQWKRLLCCICVFLGLIVFAKGLNLWDQAGYTSAEWENYSEFNLLRGRLYDFGFPGYEEHKEIYEEMGIDESASEMLAAYNLLDTEKFTTDKLRKIYDLKEKTKIDANLLKEFVNSIPLRLLKIPSFYCATVILFCWLIACKKRWDNTLVVIFEILAVIVVYFYLFYVGRYMLNRIDVGIWMAFSLVVLWVSDEERKDITQRSGIVIAGATLLMYMYMWSPRLWGNCVASANDMWEKRAAIEEITKDKDCLYLVKVKLLETYNAYRPFDRIPDNTIDNILPMGGWTLHSEIDNDIMEQYQLNNPYIDAINNEKVRIVDNNIDITMRYINTWYDEKAKAKLIKKVDGIPVYEIESPNTSK